MELADFACQRTRSSVFILGIPESDENRERASVTNDIVKARAERLSPRLKKKLIGNIEESAVSRLAHAISN